VVEGLRYKHVSSVSLLTCLVEKFLTTYLPSWYALPYHPTSGSEWKSLVMRGTAVETMEESRSMRKQTKVTAAMTVKSLKPETHSGSWSWFAGLSCLGVCFDPGLSSSSCSSDGDLEWSSSLSFFSKSSASEGCCEGGCVDAIVYYKNQRIKENDAVKSREWRVEWMMEGGSRS